MLMADHLILSLQPLPCFPHRRWRFPSGIRYSIPEFRFSSQLANSTSSSQSSSSPLPPTSSAPEKFDLVSTTQLKDGSHVFRFGDASEIEKILETEQNVKKQQRAKIVEEEHVLAYLDPVSESEGLKEISDSKKKKLVDSKEEITVSSSLSNVIKIKDRKRVRSPTKKKKDTSISVNVDNVEAKVAVVSNMSSSEEEVVSGKSELINENDVTAELYIVEPLSSQVMEDKKETSTEDNVEAKVDVVSNMSSTEEEVVSGKSELINENDVTAESEPITSEVMEKVSVIEIGDREPNGYQQITEKRMEIQARPRSSTSQHDSQSAIELDGSLDVRETLMKNSEAEDDLVVKPTVTAVVSPDGPVSTSEAIAPVSHDEPVSASEATAVVSLDEPVPASEATAAVSPDEPVSASEAIAAMSPDEPVSASEATAPVFPDEPVSTSEATAVLSPDEPNSTSEETHQSVDKIAENPVVNNEENAASTVEDTTTDNGSISKPANDTKVEDIQLTPPETADLESSEVASGREELVSKAFYLDSGFASLPNPIEALAGREDAYFISHQNWLGIADGVSQWSFGGINKGIYAQELMSNCEKIVSDETTKTLDPVQVLHRSVEATKSFGSSTALIAHLDNNELHIANIGDSGFMVIRNGIVLQRSSPMFHHFCFPLQITKGDDVLKLAEVYNVNLQEGDVVITATDGLYDNLYEEEIVSIVCSSLEQSLEPQRIAEFVAAKAQEVGGSGKERTPFADAAKEEGYDGYKGGKLDAVTVIISLVKSVSV